GADDRETLRQRAGERAAAERAFGRTHCAIEAAVALVVEPPVPGLGQAHLEADGVVAPVAALAFVHAALDQAVRGDGLATDLQAARGHRCRRFDACGRVLELRGQGLAGLQRGAAGRAQ